MNKEASFLHNMFRKEVEPEYSFDKPHIQVTFIAKMIAFVLWCLGSVLISLGIVGGMNIIARGNMIVFGVMFLSGAYVFINPKNTFLKEKNELWGFAKPLREKVEKEMDIAKAIRQELEWCETAFAKCVELKSYSYYSKASDERLGKYVTRTSKMLSMLSFGILNIDTEVLMPKPDQLWSDWQMEKWKEHVGIIKEQCESIERVWASQLFPAKFIEPIYDIHWEENIAEYGKEHGIKSMIGAYIAGVPIDDIIV